MKIGILTGGGDAPGLNAVIRSATKAAVLQHGWEVVGIRDGFTGLIDTSNVMQLTLQTVRGLLPRGGTILGTTNRTNPFHYPVTKAGPTEWMDRSEVVVKNYKQLGLDGLLVIGGDGTLKIARDLIEKGLNIIGIPKTIDNDISATDVTFGFNTAVTTAMEAIDKLHTTAESHHRVMILEVMGRNAGWIALEAGLAGGSDVILIPEIPFQYHSLFQKIEHRNSKNIKFSIVVIAEGSHPMDGGIVYQEEPVIGQNRRLGGISQHVAQNITKNMCIETRVTVLGHLQRGGSPTAFDRILASQFGAAAIQLIEQNDFGKMVCLQGSSIESVQIDQAVGILKTVPLDHQLIKTAEALGICLGV